MLRNYVLIAWRNLQRSTLYSVLNVIGLATGMAVSILILLFVAHEFSYDRFHANIQHLYRPIASIRYAGQTMQMMNMSAQFGPALQRDIPEVAGFVRIREARRVVVKSDAQHRFFESKFIFADNALFTVFSFPLRRGTPGQVLNRPHTVVLTERAARKYFGDQNPIGKTIIYDGKHTLEITGIAENPPSNSTIDFDFVGSFASLAVVEHTERHTLDNGPIPYESTDVGPGNYLTYFQLRPGADKKKVEQMIPRLTQDTGWGRDSTGFRLEPLLGTRLSGELQNVAESRYVHTFLGVALAILALALINYMNLTTARATQRAKEVGIRKTMGARQWELAVQFYGESVLTCLLAFGLALTLVQLLRPIFYNLLQLRIDNSFFYTPLFMGVLLALLLFCALVAGSYPALLLSRFAPTEVLKGKLSTTGGGARVRRVLTVVQFAVSMGLIGCSLVVQRQLDYLRSQQLGLHKEQVLVLPLDASLVQSYAALKNQIRKESGVAGVAAASSPLYKYGHNMLFTKSMDTGQDVMVSFFSVDENFFQTLGTTWKTAPPNSSRMRGKNKIVVNETAVKKLGLKGNPIGQKIEFGGENEIVGVLKDFHFTTLRQKIDGLVLSIAPDTLRSMASMGGCLYVRLDPKANLPDKIATIKKIYEQAGTDKPFEYFFLDEAFQALYEAEDRLANMFKVFTGFAVFIACLGLFGLVTYVAATRTKEIGIRKVLGATVPGIVLLLSKDFIKLLLLAFGLATPLAWYMMHSWLQEYAYRIQLGAGLFVGAGLLLWGVAWLTVLVQTIRAARANPVDSLRYE